MGCCGNRRGDERRTVTLVMGREQLLYDIRNMAYVESHIMGDDEECLKHTVADIGEDGNVDRVNRMLALVHAEVIERLYPYTKEEVAEEVVDDRMWEPREYAVELSLPVTVSRTTVYLLSQLVHEYMACRVLRDWLAVTKPEAAERWDIKAQEALAAMERVKDLRRGPVRIRQSPF